MITTLQVTTMGTMIKITQLITIEHDIGRKGRRKIYNGHNEHESGHDEQKLFNGHNQHDVGHN